MPVSLPAHIVTPALITICRVAYTFSRRFMVRRRATVIFRTVLRVVLFGLEKYDSRYVMNKAEVKPIGPFPHVWMENHNCHVKIGLRKDVYISLYVVVSTVVVVTGVAIFYHVVIKLVVYLIQKDSGKKIDKLNQEDKLKEN